jgi:hypothetical protein
MNLASWALPSVGVCAAGAVFLLIARNWRWMLVGLALVYLGAFGLTALSWPAPLAAIKAVAGWMAVAILGATVATNQPAWQHTEDSWPAGRLFRLTASGLVGIALFSAAPQIAAWLPGKPLEITWGSLALVGLGLLHLGLTAHPLRAAVAILTSLAGFEVFYAAVESSVLVAGLLAVITLGIALAGAYLLVAPSLEPDA